MNIALVRMAWFVPYSQQEMIQWLWAISWWVRHWVPKSNEDQWSMVTTTTKLLKRGAYIVVWMAHIIQLGKYFNKQYKKQNIIQQKYYTTSYQTKINKQTTISCKTMQNRVHIWSLKSNTKLSLQCPQWSHYYERPRKLPLKKRDFLSTF